MSVFPVQHDNVVDKLINFLLAYISPHSVSGVIMGVWYMG